MHDLSGFSVGHCGDGAGIDYHRIVTAAALLGERNTKASPPQLLGDSLALVMIDAAAEGKYQRRALMRRAARILAHAEILRVI